LTVICIVVSSEKKQLANAQGQQRTIYTEYNIKCAWMKPLNADDNMYNVLV